jgi:elongation factor Ts
MADITAKDVQALRAATGAGMMDCKRALQQTEGDFDAAVKFLREKGLADTAKRADRDNTEGAVAVATNGTRAGIVELRCETDFVAKSEDFLALAQRLADAVAADGEGAVAALASAVDDLKVALKENIAVGRVASVAGPDGSTLDTYLHVQNERGVNGVAVVLASGSQELAHDVALHIASARPKWLTRDDVPSDVVANEREVLANLTRNEGKPEAAIEKIVEGRLGGFFRDNCLLEQGFVKEPKRSVADVVGASAVLAYAQVEIGR